MTDQPSMVEVADPSWFIRVLRTLEREYPEISSKVWTMAITENERERQSKLKINSEYGKSRSQYPPNVS